MRLHEAPRDPALCARALGLIAAAAGCFALGAYAGPHVATGIAIVGYVAAFCCLLSLRLAARRRATAATVLMLAFGGVTGLALAPTVAYYTGADPRVMWQAGGMAGLFTAAGGVVGLLGRPRLPWLTRICLTEVLATLLCGIVLVSGYMALPQIGWAAVAVATYFSLAVLGISLVRRTRHLTSAPLLAASVFAAPADAFFYVLRNCLGLAFDLAVRRQAGLAPGPARSR